MSVRAAIVGLGRIGSRFDEEASRTTVWSHAGAYLSRRDSFELAGACETDPANTAAFALRCPAVPVYRDLRSMLDAVKPAVVSICTPPAHHATALQEILSCESVRAIWCEKPLAMTVEEGAAMVAACRARGVTMVVSYVRRWLPVWARARDIARQGTLGTVRMVRIALPNRLWSMGSHAVDLVQFLGGSIERVVAMPIPRLFEEQEPAVAAMFGFAGGGYGIFEVTGWKANYLIEAEILGDEGRIVVREDRGTITREGFVPSTRYDGYREPGEVLVERVDTPDGFSPFVKIAGELAELLAGAQVAPTCDGEAALAVQRVLGQMNDAVEQKGLQR
jgi:predicted dehydrogenase